MRDVFIVLGVVILVAAGVTLLRFRRDMKELFSWPSVKRPVPPREPLKELFPGLRPSSPLGDYALLLRGEEDDSAKEVLIAAVTARPRLQEEVAQLLTADNWGDRSLGFFVFDRVPAPSRELATHAASAVRDFARSLPGAAFEPKRDLWWAAHVCETLRDHGFHDDAVAREYLRALRAHFGGRKDLEYIDATMVSCLDEDR